MDQKLQKLVTYQKITQHNFKSISKRITTRNPTKETFKNEDDDIYYE